MAEPKQLANSFEDAIQQLEKIVEHMEHGDLPLDEALTQFERGVALAQHSQQALNSAEQKVKLLLQSKQGSVLTDLNDDDNDAAY